MNSIVSTDSASNNSAIIVYVFIFVFLYQLFIAKEKGLKCEDGEIEEAYGYQGRSLC